LFRITKAALLHGKRVVFGAPNNGF